MLFVIIILCHLYSMILSTENFNYEKGNIYGLGRRFMDNNWPQEYQKSLASDHTQFAISPYKSLYQGTRILNDTRVFNKKFEYTAKSERYKLFCQEVFECTLTHLAIETSGNKPVLLRGGVGYKHFTVVVQAEPGDELVVHIRAYCARTQGNKHSYVLPVHFQNVFDER